MIILQKVTRTLLPLWGALTIVACAEYPGGGQSEKLSGARPNIVLIMTDDMGYSDIGPYGGEIQTPTLDRLAAGGLRFTQFYNAGRCCPTRASLLTGLYPHQAGVGAMVSDFNLPGYRGYLNEQCVTIAEVLKTGGYHTLMAGKWHVGENRPHWPVDRGFDRYFGLISGANSFFHLNPGRQMANDNEPYIPFDDDFYMTDAFTDHAIQFLDEVSGDEAPFFLYVPYTAPHWPLHALPEDIAKYQGTYMEGWGALREARYARMIDMGIIDPQWALSPPDEGANNPWESAEDKEDWDLRMAVYAAQIDRVDQGIGKIMDKISALGVEDNTLVLFLADNGGCHEIVDRGSPGIPAGGAESFLSYGREWANASNTPFRLYKHWVHEGGIATPLIAYWPQGIRNPGAITGEVGHIIDIMATCIDVAGVDYPAQYQGNTITPLEGKSLVPVFQTGQREPHDAIFWEHMGNRAVRQDQWKLVSADDGPWELYDLAKDRSEMNNLIEQHPENARELQTMYDRWADRAQVETPADIRAFRAQQRENQ